MQGVGSMMTQKTIRVGRGTRAANKDTAYPAYDSRATSEAILNLTNPLVMVNLGERKTEKSAHCSGLYHALLCTVRMRNEFEVSNSADEPG